MLKTTYLLLGTNLGDRDKNLAVARRHVEKKIGSIPALSQVYETAAWGKEGQPAFLNQVAMVKTNSSPHALLEGLQKIETLMGRERKEKWGPRIIDLDILFYENEIIHDECLTVPHPGIPWRRFTLLPLHDIAPNWVHPVLNKTIGQLLAECPDKLPAKPYTAP
ncbi:MAG TPA: 2-amino-4-hydroxy-6-hydroxymethyldihydropteridine diphosphokinase [Cyclobacteriaceae bacterium]|nr:2-amino-4-hydroxy-6-hydroxymethyldihydropteridine diphosphokinase [Cyclobacteriaceae bacterium]